MLLAIAGTTLLMGLVGGPHCLAMCAAPCHAVVTGTQQVAVLRPQRHEKKRKWWSADWLGYVQFHAGRAIGYGSLGAAAAMAVEQVAWFADHTSWLHPLWVLMHLAVLGWGLWMLFQAQQPAWLERGGRAIWLRVAPALRWRGMRSLSGLAWALMPCGLLYSALSVSALSANPLVGAVGMLSFAAGSTAWLLLGPLLWRWAGQRLGQWRAQWGMRVAGGLLTAVAVGALWMDLVYKPSLWCR